MEQPNEPGYYWYKEPEDEPKICKVFLSDPWDPEDPKELIICFLQESNADYPLSVIEPGTQFKKIEEWKF